MEIYASLLLIKPQACLSILLAVPFRPFSRLPFSGTALQSKQSEDLNLISTSVEFSKALVTEYSRTEPWSKSVKERLHMIGTPTCGRVNYCTYHPIYHPTFATPRPTATSFSRPAAARCRSDTHAPDDQQKDPLHLRIDLLLHNRRCEVLHPRVSQPIKSLPHSSNHVCPLPLL